MSAPNVNISNELIPRDKLAVDSTFQYQRKTPLLLYSFFTELIRSVYSDPSGTFGLGWVWDKDNTKSTIFIDTEYTWRAQLPAPLPAIYVVLSPISYSSVGVDSGKVSFDMTEAETTYHRVGVGMVTYVHSTKTNMETVRLVSDTLDVVDALADVIRSDAGFRKLRVVNAHPLALVRKGDTEIYQGQVQLAYEFEDNWVIKLESPKLKQLVMETGNAAINGVQ